MLMLEVFNTQKLTIVFQFAFPLLFFIVCLLTLLYLRLTPFFGVV